MSYRGLIDRKGELFAYLDGTTLYTLEGEATGRWEGDFIIDMAGNQMWRIVGDGVYAVDGSETVGYLATSTPPDY
jgi:hypothetical protein